MKYITY